jgi:hypothetical protein
MNDWVRESIQRVRAFFHREELDREFDEEMAAHLELAKKENLERGMSVDEAGRQALIRFGGTQQAKESHREARALPVVDALLQDVSFGARMLGKNFCFTGVAVIALTLGIGFSSIIFSIFYNGVLYPFPYRDPSV